MFTIINISADTALSHIWGKGVPGGSDGKESACNAMRETWVPSLGREGPLEKGIATHSSILAWRIPCRKKPNGYSPWSCKESDTTENTSTHMCTRVLIYTYT